MYHNEMQQALVPNFTNFADIYMFELLECVMYHIQQHFIARYEEAPLALKGF